MVRSAFRFPLSAFRFSAFRFPLSAFRFSAFPLFRAPNSALLAPCSSLPICATLHGMNQVRIGLSGFSYKPWQGEGRFYPAELKQKDFLPFYAERYNAVEMDGTWYRMPSEDGVKSWLANSPEDFKFCFKAHRQVTHLARLKPEAIEPLKFMLKRLEPMRPRLGPILLQLPPNLKRDDARLESFLAALPAEIPAQTQWAVEFRNESWHTTEVEAILRKHNVAWVAAETDDAPAQRRNTANYGYARLRKSEYDSKELKGWAEYFQSIGGPVYAFCKHEDEGAPWIWADELLTYLQ